jgi:hypothetical protein
MRGVDLRDQSRAQICRHRGCPTRDGAPHRMYATSAKAGRLRAIGASAARRSCRKLPRCSSALGGLSV